MDETIKKEIHDLRKSVDANIQAAKTLQEHLPTGKREAALVITKLQEGKMWAGKILEELGSELPAEYRDEAPKV